MADITISQSVRSIVNLIQRPGLIRIGFDDLLAALRSRNGRCLFGFGESDSDNRAHDALTQALKNPLMDRGRMLADAAHVLVQVAGGPGMTLSEVEILMQELGRHVSERNADSFRHGGRRPNGRSVERDDHQFAYGGRGFVRRLRPPLSSRAAQCRQCRNSLQKLRRRSRSSPNQLPMEDFQPAETTAD